MGLCVCLRAEFKEMIKVRDYLCSAIENLGLVLVLTLILVLTLVLVVCVGGQSLGAARGWREVQS